MPQIDWTPEHKRTTSVEFNRLKLKVGEKARIVCLEKPTFAWVHTMRAPKIIDGMASKVLKKRKDGSEFADWDMDYIGRPQCLGDYGTIAEDGLDPANCPVCARAKESEECQSPERRFAMNLIRYNTKADGNLISPFGCSSYVWSFTENNFNKLLDLAQENGGLVGRDLVLGPCQPPEAYQKFDIIAGGRNVWETDDTIKKMVVETHNQNRVEDVEAACGRRVEVKWLKSDLDKIRAAWQIARGETAGASSITEKAEVATLKGELDNLLTPAPAPANPTTTGAADAPPAPQGGAPDDFSKLLAGLQI